ncbi:hypothetical protein [Kribbella sp. NPDC048928]|uniref:hypothetical protein n=1 Tax=Kribbella sp. NPDC048928 TaxID=3364111 RepID=UPI00371F755D
MHGPKPCRSGPTYLDPSGRARWAGVRRPSPRRTILVSSHVLSEVEQTVDDIVIIDNGQLIRQGSLAELARQQGSTIVIPAPNPDHVSAALSRLAPPPDVQRRDGALMVRLLKAELRQPEATAEV